MENDTKIMLKKVILYDFMILIITLVVSMTLFSAYALTTAMGVLMALMNFILNALTTNFALTRAGNSSLPVMGAVIRVVITAFVAIVLCHNEPGNFISFLAGYSVHYISLILYGVTGGVNKKRE